MAKLMTLKQANTVIDKLEELGLWASKTMWHRQAYSVTAVYQLTRDRITFESVDEFEEWMNALPPRV